MMEYTERVQQGASEASPPACNIYEEKLLSISTYILHAWLVLLAKLYIDLLLQEGAYRSKSGQRD